MTPPAPPAAPASPPTAATDLPRRRAHWLGDGTERLFTRGQQRLFAQDFVGAVVLLTQAAERDPGYAGIACWLGMALSEAALSGDRGAAAKGDAPRDGAGASPVSPAAAAGDSTSHAAAAAGQASRDAADAAFARAIALRAAQGGEPRACRAYDHMERGLSWLDAGRPDVAREHLSAARERDPHNPLVQAGLDLLAWDEGQLTEAAVLLTGFDQRMARHQARVLVRLAAQARAGGDPGPVPVAPPEPGLTGWLERRGQRRNATRFGQAEAAIAASDGRGAVELLREIEPVDAAERAFREALFRQACEVVVAELRVRRAAPGGKDDARQRLELELGRYLDACEQREEAAALGAARLNAFRKAGCPADDLAAAQDAAAWVAAAQLAADDGRGAVTTLEQAFAWRPDHGFPELDRLAALAHLACGEVQRARWAFQRWVGASHLPAEQVLESISP